MEAAGAGAIPSPKRTGLNIEPPPSPKAPETHPPMKANINNLTRVHPTGEMSLGQRPWLYFFFRENSFFRVKTAKTVIAILKAK